MKRERKLKLALDTTNVLGSGAVKDTYNLLADGIAMLIRELARLAGRRRSELEEGSKDERRLLAAGQLLSQPLLQDVERKEGKVQIGDQRRAHPFGPRP